MGMIAIKVRDGPHAIAEFEADRVDAALCRWMRRTNHPAMIPFTESRLAGPSQKQHAQPKA
jgi:hypothetical protein